MTTPLLAILQALEPHFASVPDGLYIQEVLAFILYCLYMVPYCILFVHTADAGGIKAGRFANKLTGMAIERFGMPLCNHGLVSCSPWVVKAKDTVGSLVTAGKELLSSNLGSCYPIAAASSSVLPVSATSELTMLVIKSRRRRILFVVTFFSLCTIGAYSFFANVSSTVLVK